MKFCKLCLFLALMVFLMIGCSNVKDANEKNFKAAAQDFLNTQYPYAYILADFPCNTEDFKYSIKNTTAILSVLDTLGIVKETETSRRDIPASLLSEARTEIIYSYELTDAGRKFYKTDAAKSISNKDMGGFSFGKANIVKIVNFSEPTSFMGYKVSEVTYTYTVSNLPAWVNNAKLLELNHELQKAVESANTPIKRTDMFILTGKGWIHERLMKE